MTDPNDPNDPTDPTDRPGVVDAAADDGPPPAPDAVATEARRAPVWQRALLALRGPVLSIVTALAVGAVVLVFTDPDTLGSWSKFSSNPGRAFRDSWHLVADAYEALFRGAFGTPAAWSETFVAATPLILAGLAVGFAFRSGLFNIGGSGQALLGSLTAAYVGFHYDWPLAIHIPVALVAAAVAGGLWAGVAGLLKARTGAHEVISTIMLNYIALHLVDYLLGTKPFLRPGRADPITPPVHESAQLPKLLGAQYRLHVGIVVALVLAALIWWLLFRTTVGFRLRTVGANPNAATYAGMSVATTWVLAMAISGGLAGLAGGIQMLGVQKSLSGGLPSVGFDAIALALLGRAHPAGIVAASILFGALTAGGTQMQGTTGTPVDMITVIQALIIAFIAAPALIRAIWRVKEPEGTGQVLATGWG